MLFRFRPPDYWRSDAYALYKMTDGQRGWDGFLYPFRKTSQISGTVLRGRLEDLLAFCETEEFEVDKTKLLPKPFGLTTDDIPDDIVKADFELDDDQRQAIVEWLNNAIGVHRMVVSSGKTVTFCATAAMIKRKFPKARFLYLTPTERLVRQVTKEAKKFLPDWDISQYGGGGQNKDGKDMVVATAAILYRNFKTLLRDKWFQTHMCLLIDECQFSCSPSWEKIILATPAFFRFGASDSTKENDIVKHTKIKGLIGPKLFSIDAAPLIKKGRIAVPHIYTVEVKDWRGKFSHLSHAPDPESTAWALIDDEWKKGLYLGPPVIEGEDGKFTQKTGYHLIQIGKEEYEVESRWCLLNRLYDKAVITFKERNNLIAEWVKHYTDKGWPTLVVCTRTLHVMILQQLIAKVIGDPDRVDILFSDHSSKERDEVFEWFKTTPGSVLVTPLVKVGVSINEIRAGVIADYIADSEFAQQVIGRFIRKKKGEENFAQITWLVDKQHPTMQRNTRKLMYELQKIEGYKFIEGYIHPPTEEVEQLELSLSST